MARSLKKSEPKSDRTALQSEESNSSDSDDDGEQKESNERGGGEGSTKQQQLWSRSHDVVDVGRDPTLPQQQLPQSTEGGALIHQLHQARLPFPHRLHRILEEAEERNLTHIIGWTHNGEGFKVHNKHAFEAKFIPRYFSTTTYRGYHRNLNLWGFKTVNRGGDRGTCWHPYFKRGRPELCRYMERMALKRNQPICQNQGGSATKDRHETTVSPAQAPLSTLTVEGSCHQSTSNLPGEQIEEMMATNPNFEDQKPAARESTSQENEQGSALQHHSSFLPSRQLLHSNNPLWNQTIDSFVSSLGGISNLGYQVGSHHHHHHLHYQPTNLLQQLIPGALSVLSNNNSGVSHEPSPLRQILQTQLGTTLLNTNDQLTQQLLLQILQQSNGGSSMQVAQPVASLARTAAGTSQDLLTQVQLLLQAQQVGQQQSTLQDLIQTFQSQQEQPPNR